MKLLRLLLVVVSIATYSIGIAQDAVETDATKLKADLKTLLKPDYKYDSSTTTRFKYSSEAKGKEIEVPLFMGEKYRFLFNIAGAENIEINIYDKSSVKEKRTLLFSSKNAVSDGKIYTFEPEKSRKMYINYTIPSSENTETSGCVLFMLGYKFKTL
jgi:hypothetical protein